MLTLMVGKNIGQYLHDKEKFEINSMIQDFQMELYIIKLIDNLKYQYKFGNEYNIGSITNQSTIHGKVK